MKVTDKLKAAWSSLPLSWRKEITSVTHTFIATFAVLIATQLSQGTMPLSTDALLALGVTAARAAWKAAMNSIIASSKKSEGESPQE